MKHAPHPARLMAAILLLVAACGSDTPTGVETDDIRGTWSGTFSEFSLMGRTLSGDADWTFTRDTFEIIFFNPPEGQAERISGDWKFSSGRIALKLTSSFPIDSDIGATDTLFVSILRDEMSIKTIAESSILLVRTRVASLTQPPTSKAWNHGKHGRHGEEIEEKVVLESGFPFYLASGEIIPDADLHSRVSAGRRYVRKPQNQISWKCT